MATTITGYSVSLNLDASNYIRNSGLSGRETAKLRRDIERARDPSEKLARSVNQLDKALKAGAIDMKTYNRLLEDQEKRLKKTDQATKSKTSSIVAMGARYVGAAAAMAAAGKSIKAFAGAEAIQTQMEVLTGSADNAKVLFQEIRDISASSPITFEGAADAVRTMLLFNVATSDVIPNLKMLGDITGGDTERMKSLALAFSQATAAGRLQGQDLRQMIDAGFNPLQVIAAKTGETLDEVRLRMGESESGLDLMNEAFQMATAEGGRFHDMLEKMGEKTGGQLAKMSSQIQVLAMEIGDGISPVIKQVGGLMEDWGPILEGAVFLVSKLGDGLSFVLAVTRDIINPLAEMFTPDDNGVFGTIETPLFDKTNEFLDDFDKKQKEAQKDAQKSVNNLVDAEGFAAKRLQYQKDTQKSVNNLVEAEGFVNSELGQQVDNVNKVVQAENAATKAAEDRVKAYQDAQAKLQDAVVSETFDLASRRFGADATEQLRLAYSMMDKAQQRWMLENIEQGVGFDTLMSQAPEQEMFKELNARQKLNQAAEDLAKIEDDIGKAREKYAKNVLDIQRKEIEERDAMLAKQNSAIARGPGSGLDDPQRFLAQQVNQRMADSITDRRRREGVPINDEQRERREELKQELAELRRLEMKAEHERQKQTELLTTISQNGFQRIR